MKQHGIRQSYLRTIFPRTLLRNNFPSMQCPKEFNKVDGSNFEIIVLDAYFDKIAKGIIKYENKVLCSLWPVGK